MFNDIIIYKENRYAFMVIPKCTIDSVTIKLALSQSDTHT